MRANRHGRRREDGTSAILGLLIGMTVFVGSFVYIVNVAVDTDTDTGAADEARFSLTAKSLSDIILSPGTGWKGDPNPSPGAPGPNDPASLCPDYDVYPTDRIDGDGIGAGAGRFGLGADPCDPGRATRIPNQLSFWKFQNLYNAKDDETANEKVDYESARASLGLDEAQIGFHIRSFPVLASTRELLRSERQDTNVKALYIGNYQQLSQGGGPASRNVDHSKNSPGAAPCSDRIRVEVTVTNGFQGTNGGTSTIFTVDFHALVKFGMDFQLQTPLLSPGQSYTVGATILKSKDWLWKKANEPFIDYEISDRLPDELGSGRFDLSGINMADTNCSGTVTNADETRINAFIRSAAPSFDKSGGSAATNIEAKAFDGTGKAATMTDWTYRLWNGASYLHTLALPNGGTATAPYTINAPAFASYTAELRSDNPYTTLWNTDLINVYQGTEPAYQLGGVSGQYAASSIALRETKFLDLLLYHFDRAVVPEDYQTAQIPWDAVNGDVHPADKHLMKDWLETVLKPGGTASTAKYNLMVVGSDVDQTVMNSGAVKWTVEEWVEAGGTLIVLGGGGDKEHNNWLQPVYGASQDTANGGLYTPDEDHPLLNVPNDLNYVAYNVAYEWDVGNPAFTPVVQTSSGDVLTAGNAGSLGRGRVILAGWMPAELTPDANTVCADSQLNAETSCEGLFLFHNLVSFSYRDLYLDYGPPIPVGDATGSQIRIGTLWHPEVGKSFSIEMQVYVFPQG